MRDAVTQMNSNASGGVIYQHGNEYIIKGDIATSDLDKISNTVILTDDAGMPVGLCDIAEMKGRCGGASLEHRLGQCHSGRIAYCNKAAGSRFDKPDRGNRGLPGTVAENNAV